MAIANNGVPQNPLVITDNLVGSRIFLGTTTPSNPVSGDIWIDANPLNNAGKNAISATTVNSTTANFSVPSSYKDVCLILRNLSLSAAGNLLITLNSDTGSNYAGQVIGGSSITTALFSVPLTTATTQNLILTLQDTQDTSSWQMGRLEGNNGTAILAAGLYKTPVAISSITVTSTATISCSSTVYGVN